MDYRVLLFALTISVATGLLSSLRAALRSSRVELRESLQSDGRGSGSGRRGQRLRRGLVITQIALCLPLVIGAAAVVLSSLRFADMNPGFDTERLVALRVSFAGEAYDTPEERVAFVEQLLPRLRALQQVETVTAASHIPLINRNDVPWSRFVPEGWEQGISQPPSTSVRYAADDYHRAMGIPVVLGRSFTAAEARSATSGVAVINQTMASRFWPDGDAVGQRIQLVGDDPTSWRTVVGVAGDVMQRGLTAAPENQLYLPYAETRELTLVLRASGDPAALVPDARAITRSLDPGLPLYDVRTMQDAYDWFFRDRVSQGIVLGSLGVVALLLALLGVYGVMAFTVAQRTREFGIRMALGGDRRNVLRLVLRGGLLLVGVGTGIGLLLALALTRVLSAIFDALPAFQPVLFVGVSSLLAAAVLLASYLPARRATRVDPMIALRAE